MFHLRRIVCGLGLWSILCGVSTVQGVVVTNVTTNTVIFNSNGFEHDYPEHEPYAILQKAACPKPWKTAVAPWDQVVSRVNRFVHVKPPATTGGFRYLKTMRDAAGSGSPTALFSSNQSRDGDLIRMEFQLRLPTDVDATIFLGHDGPGVYRGMVRLFERRVQFHDGDAWNDFQPAVAFVPDKWQDWILEYEIGAATFGIRVDDGPAGRATALESATSRGGGSLNQLGFTHRREQSFEIDASDAMRAAAAARRTEVQASQDLPQLLQINWRVGPDLPQGVQTVGAGVINETLVWVGGFCSGGTIYPNNLVPGKPDRYPRGFLDKTWGLKLNDFADGWRSLPKLPGAPRQALTSAVVHDALYVFGGFSYDDMTYRDGYRLSRTSGEWQWDRIPDLPWKICFAGAASAGNQIFMLGGCDVFRQTSGSYYTNASHDGKTARIGARLIALDTTNGAAGWKELPECPGTPRFMPATTIVGEYLYVFGGISGHDNAQKQVNVVVDNWRYHLANKKWERLADLPVASTRHPNNYIVYDERYILLIAGATTKYVLNPDGTSRLAYGRPHRTQWGRTMFSDVTVYDVQTGKFGRANPMPLCNNMPTAVVHKNSLYLIGGECEGVEFNGVHYGHHPDLLLIGDISPVRPNDGSIESPQPLPAATPANQ